MKTIFWFISLIFFSLQTMSQITHVERFAISDFIIDDTLCPDQETYSYFPSYKEETINKPGAPALPLVPIKLLMPTGSRIDSIKIELGDTTVVRLNHFLIPYQQPVTLSCPEIRFTSIDSSIYHNINSFPLDLFRYTIGQWYNAQIVNIDLFPFKYYPVENKLVLFNSMTINLYYTDSINNGSQIKMEKNFYLNYLKSLTSIIKNPEEIESYIKNVTVLEKKPASTQSEPNMDYVVVVNNSFVNSEALKTFIDWKKRKGVDIALVDWTQLPNLPDDICGVNQTNYQYIDDNAAKIRMFLKQVSNNGGCKYVLLVGDDILIPVRKFYAEHGTYDFSRVITDKYYADYHSDYAVDSDTDYGEYNGDAVDLYPDEAFVGRIPCSNEEELNVWVNKLLSYETNPGNGDASYLKKFVMTMADEPQ